MVGQRHLALPESGYLGVTTAQDVVAYAMSRFPAVIDQVEAWLRTQSDGPVSYWFWSVAVLSKVELRSDMDRVTVVSALAGHGHRIAIARIGVHRDGTVGWHPFREVEPPARVPI